MLDILDQIDTKVFVPLLAGIVILSLAITTLYAIQPQVKDLRNGYLTHKDLKIIVANKDELKDQITGLENKVNKMKRKLKGDMANLPEKKMEAYIIGELQNISWNHQIDLIGVKPVEGNEIQMFQEILFKVQLAGEYFDLYSWLIDLRNQLGFIVIKNLEINKFKQNDRDSTLSMKLTIASYKHI